MIINNKRLKKCFIRFEPDIDDGTVFIFNKETAEMIEGDYYCYLIAKALQMNMDLNVLAQQIAIANNQTITEVEKNILEIVNYLDKEGFVQNE